MDSFRIVLVLSLGGAFGVNARFWLGYWISRWSAAAFPWATFIINVTGSFAIGFFTFSLLRWLPHPNFRLLLVVGFLGGYTTFSSFSFESLTLIERGQTMLAIAYVVGSVAAGLGSVAVGAALARSITSPSPERVASASVSPSNKREEGPQPAPKQASPSASSKKPSSPGATDPPGHEQTAHEASP